MTYDVIVATDVRLVGGSLSTLEEIRVQHRAGLRSAVYPLSSPLAGDAAVHPGFADAVRRGECDILEAGSAVEARLLVFRNPAVIPHFGAALPAIDAETVALVINHPPVAPEGYGLYLLTYAYRRLRESYGTAPKCYPVGPVLRAALTKYYGAAAPLEDWDWVPIFDLGRFATTRTTARQPIRIGRHARPGGEKWPGSAADLLHAYPERDDVDVRILGGTERPEAMLRKRPRNWTVYDYGSRKPEEFLREIDIFVYYHHSKWIESFGRTVIEAMASGLPAILPPSFAPLCGEAALYSEPKGVIDHIALLRDPAEYRGLSERALAFAQGFSEDTHMKRLAGLGVV